MEKTLVKKNLHLTPQEKRHVAQMLDKGPITVCRHESTLQSLAGGEKT